MKISKKKLIEAAETLAKDFRVLHGNPTLSFPDDAEGYKATLNEPKSLILMVGDWRGNGEDMTAATKNMAYQLSKMFNTGHSMQDFR